MICQHAIPPHVYADGRQLHVIFASRDSAAALNGVRLCLAPVQSWMSKNKLKLNPDKTEFLLIGNDWQWREFLSMFPIELLGVRNKPAKSARRNLGVIYKNIPPSSHIYQQSVDHAFTICGICAVFAITLIWIVENYSQLLSFLIVSIIAIHFCMVLLTLTSQGLSLYRINCPACCKSLLHLLAVFHCFVPSIGCQ